MDGMNFDPMTGQPVNNQQAAPQQGKVVGFDPMTGQPVYENAQASAPQYGTDTVGYYQPPKKSNIGIIIAIIAAAVVLVAGGVVAAVLMLGGSPKAKVATAINNTFSNMAKGDNLLLTALDVSEITDSEELVADVSLEYSDYWGDKTEADVTVNKTKDAIQLDGEITSPDLMGIPIDAVFLFDDKYIKASSSLLDYVFLYDYTSDANGYAVDMLGVEMEDVNESVKAVYDAAFSEKSSKEISLELIADIKEVYDDLEIEKIDKEEFEINGKDVKCPGYEMKLDENDIENIIDAYFKFYEDNYGDSLDKLLEASGEDTLEELKEDMLDDIGDVDMEIRFYIYKNQLAAIQVEVDNEEVSIEFQGGDYRAQNILIKADDEKLSIKCEKDKTKETLKVSFGKEEILSYKYDSKSGDLTVKINNGWEEIELDDIVIKNDGKKFELKLDSMPLDDYSDEEITLSVVVKAGGAEISDMNGKEFYFFEADYDEFEEIVEEIEELIYSYY